MTRSQAWLGCGLVVLTPILFITTFLVAGVDYLVGGKDETIQTRWLVTGHLPLWCLFGGLTFVALGAALAVLHGPHAVFGRKAIGHVVGTQPAADDSDDEPEWIVRYEVGGTSYEVLTPDVGFPRPGNKVIVRYLPDDPADGRIAFTNAIFGLVFPVLFIGIGVVTVVFWLVARP